MLFKNVIVIVITFFVAVIIIVINNIFCLVIIIVISYFSRLARHFGTFEVFPIRNNGCTKAAHGRP